MKPVDFAAKGVFFDGQSSQAVPAWVTIGDDGAVQIEPAGQPRVVWPLSDIRITPDQAGSDIQSFECIHDPVARLLLTDATLLQFLPKPRRAKGPAYPARIAKWAAAAVASVALIVFVLVPVMADQLAEFIPPEGERALGEVTLGQIQNALDQTGLDPVGTCERAGGLDALATMQARLTDPLGLSQPLNVLVLDHEMINAFALPGGYIILFRGLIDAAETPEEVASVFAHEIGHVVSRDPTRHALRSAGSIGVLGLLLGDFAGGAAVLFLTERLIEANYTRAAEAGADQFAHDLLMKAGVAPSALADMFERLRDRYGDADPFVAHFLSHPQLGDRIADARAATPAGFVAEPILSPDEWAALQRICQ